MPAPFNLLASAGGAGLTGLNADIERVFDLTGIFVFALSGALLAVNKRFDIVGMLVLALMTGCGGGVIRDLLLGDTPPVAFRDAAYLILPVVATMIVFVGHGLIEQRLLGVASIFDAAGLALFSVIGTVKALTFDVGVLGAIGLGLITAVGGGVLRDVLANKAPTMFRAGSVLYSIPAALGATLVALSWSGGWYGGQIAGLAALSVFMVRAAALRYGWHAPRPAIGSDQPDPADRSR